jgi:hypothetical protein
MILTICLVTKGRELFLGDALLSYEPFIKTGEVNVILIDNGSNDQSKSVLLEWKDRNNKFVEYIRVEENVSVGTPYFWEQIQRFNPEWIIFPGDDDILVFDMFYEWKLAVSNNPDLNAFACSAVLINSESQSIGIDRSPAILRSTSKPSQLAIGIHESPFLWPGLIFKFDSIMKQVPFSRYVFDWWVGLQLISVGDTCTTSKIGVRYRVHGQQESFQTTSRRKYFEGFNMLSDYINSSIFVEALEKFSELELFEFLDNCFEYKPLYGQPEYFVSLMKELSLATLKIQRFKHLYNEVLNKYIFSAYVLSKRGDLTNTYTGFSQFDKDTEGNIAITFKEYVCDLLVNSQKFFNAQAKNKYLLKCRHSSRKSAGIFIDCTHLSNLSEIEIADFVLLAINTHLETTGVINFTLTPFERKLLTHYRQFKSRIPSIINKRLVNLKNLGNR